MQDAVILANHIYDIKPTSFENIKAALNGYRAERFDAVKDQYSQTHMAARLQFGHVNIFYQEFILYVFVTFKRVQKNRCRSRVLTTLWIFFYSYFFWANRHGGSERCDTSCSIGSPSRCSQSRCQRKVPTALKQTSCRRRPGAAPWMLFHRNPQSGSRGSRKRPRKLQPLLLFFEATREPFFFFLLSIN